MTDSARSIPLSSWRRPPLLDRMELVTLDGYTEDEKLGAHPPGPVA